MVPDIKHRLGCCPRVLWWETAGVGAGVPERGLLCPRECPGCSCLSVVRPRRVLWSPLSTQTEGMGPLPLPEECGSGERGQLSDTRAWPGSHRAVGGGDPRSGMFAEVLPWQGLRSPDVNASETKPSVSIVPGRGTPPTAGQEATANRGLCVRGPLPSRPPREFGQTASQGPPEQWLPSHGPSRVQEHSLGFPLHHLLVPLRSKPGVGD